MLPVDEIVTREYQRCNSNNAWQDVEKIDKVDSQTLPVGNPCSSTMSTLIYRYAPFLSNN